MVYSFHQVLQIATISKIISVLLQHTPWGSSTEIILLMVATIKLKEKQNVMLLQW